MIYKVYFQIYGKKMKASVIANSEEEAKEMIVNEIVFDKVVKVSDPVSDDPTVRHFKSIFGMS